MRERIQGDVSMEGWTDSGGFLEGNLSVVGQEKQKIGKEKLCVGFVDFELVGRPWSYSEGAGKL